MVTAQRLETAFRRVGACAFAGYALSIDDPARRFVIDILVDGVPTALVRAEQFDHALVALGHGDGCYGFSYVARPEWLDRHRTVEARIANMDHPVGEAVDLQSDAWREAPRRGEVRWTGGALAGWTVDRSASGQAPAIRVIVDKVVVAEVRPPVWNAVGCTEDVYADKIAFEIDFSDLLRDASCRILHVVDETGEELTGSPLTLAP